MYLYRRGNLIFLDKTWKIVSYLYVFTASMIILFACSTLYPPASAVCYWCDREFWQNNSSSYYYWNSA